MPEYDEDQHPRDEHGKFTHAGGGLGLWAQKRATRFAGPLMARAEKTGGFSYKPGASKATRTPTSGVMVSSDTKDNLGHVVEIKKMAERDPPPTAAEVRTEIKSQVKKWLEKSIPHIEGKKDQYLGGWFETDKKTGGVIALHLDISQHFHKDKKDDAIREGKARNQVAVWDIDKGEEIDTGGTGR